jgi:internalin A
VDWKGAIESALKNCRVAVLLVSPDFLASDFIARCELPLLISRARDQQLTILWVPVAASLYEETELKNLQAPCDPARPLDTLRRPQATRELVKIARAVARIVHAPRQNRATAEP